MVTTDLLRRAFEGIADDYGPPLSFTNDTNAVKDRSQTLNWPCLLWIEPTPGMLQWAEVLADTWTLTMSFAEQTASTRDEASRQEMGLAYARMCAYAKHIVSRFFDLYITSDGTVEGESLDLSLTGPVTFTRFVDEGPTMLTGCTVSFTVQDLSKVECVDGYFP